MDTDWYKMRPRVAFKCPKLLNYPSFSRETSGMPQTHHNMSALKILIIYLGKELNNWIYASSDTVPKLRVCKNPHFCCVSNWILTSCQPHRVTSGQSNSGHKQTHVRPLLILYIKLFVKSNHKTNRFANIKGNMQPWCEKCGFLQPHNQM